MALIPEDRLQVEQIMEEDNHVLLQTEISESKEKTPQLLLLSSHATNGTTSAATFSLIVHIGGRTGIALEDTSSTDTFIDYTFACKLNCPITSTTSKPVKVVGGGPLHSNATLSSTHYIIQHESFTNEFKLLQLRGYGIILGCDWIKFHSPIAIGLDLKDNSRQLIIQKEGKQKVIFQDFARPPPNPFITAAKMEKLCRGDILGYVVQINMIHQKQEEEPQSHSVLEIQAVLDVFSDKMDLPPPRDCDHEIKLKADSTPPNVRPYSVPQK
jgi:hypothetical protein